MLALHEDEDTPENRRARIEAHLRAKYPERFPQTEEVALGVDSPLSATNSPQSSAGTPPSSGSGGMQALLERYKAAGDDSEVRDAEGKAKTARLASLFGDAFSTAATAMGRARGYQSDSGGYWDRLSKLHDPDVVSAKQRVKDRQAGVLQEDQFEQAGVARDRASADWSRKQTLQGREDADYTRKQATQGEEDDPSSETSRTYQELAKTMLPSGSFEGMSATKLKSAIPALEGIYRVREQSEAKRDAAQRYKEGMEASARERALTRSEMREARREARVDAASIRAGEHELRRREKLEDEERKKVEEGKKSDSEFNQRHDNIKKNLDDLEALVDEYGTEELFGSESGQMDSLIYDVALDYAKLVDPGSVAREGEVASAKKYMLPVKGWFTSEKTAKEHIQKMRNAVDTRMKNKNANNPRSSGSAGMGEGGRGSSWRDF